MAFRLYLVRSLLQFLPKLQSVEHPGLLLMLNVERFLESSFILFSGNMGKVFDLSWEPLFGPHLALTNFSQLMTVTSGGVEVIS